MYAVIRTGGKQARVAPGDRVTVDLALDSAPIDGARYGRPGEVAFRRGPLVLAREAGREEPIDFAHAGAGGAAIATWVAR